uniref:TSA: Wollemia nobilis Ref_Wollemi_Transcript_25245_948 transcribed RNA sequence n=1 Tax=Wollemia nobilis TaxID=56998 RepID=A0A0C9S1K4_9CONI
MGKVGYLAMKTDDVSTADIKSDLKELRVAVNKLGSHTVGLLGKGLLTSLLQWLATIVAIYLLILDRTNWRTRMLTSLLVPYIFLNLPSIIFNFLRGEVGKWVSFIAVIVRLFFPRHFPDWLEMPGSLILLLVVTPNLIADLRGGYVGTIVSLIIGAYLLQEHIRSAGGFRNAFAEKRGFVNTIGIILLFVNPLWELIKLF